MKKIFILLIFTTLIFSGCAKKSYPKADYDEKQKNNAVFIMGGRIESSSSSGISSKISGKVTQVLVDVGSKVNAGDVLVKLDTSDIQIQINQAKAQVDVATANYENVKNSVRPEEKAKANAVVASSKEAYENAKADYDRMNELFNDGATTKQQLESAQLKMQSTKSQYDAALADIEMLNNGPTSETLAVASAQIKQANASLDSAKNQLNNATITAPYSGVVTKKDIEVGEFVSPGTKIISMDNNSQVLVTAQLPESMIPDVKENQEVIVKVPEDSNKTFNGTISTIDPALDTNGTGAKVKIIINNADDNVKPGMFAEVGLKK